MNNIPCSNGVKSKAFLIEMDTNPVPDQVPSSRFDLFIDYLDLFNTLLASPYKYGLR